MATIYDVAETAGVSTATVSNVLRGTRYVAPIFKRSSRRHRGSRLSAESRQPGLRFAAHAPSVSSCPTSPLDSSMGSFRRIEQRAAFTDYQIILADLRRTFLPNAIVSGRSFSVRSTGSSSFPAAMILLCLWNYGREAFRRFSWIVSVEILTSTVFPRTTLGASREGARHLISLSHRPIVLLASDPSLRNIRDGRGIPRSPAAGWPFQFRAKVLVVGRNAANTVGPALKPLLQGVSRPAPVCRNQSGLPSEHSRLSGNSDSSSPKISRSWLSTIRWFTAASGRSSRPFASQPDFRRSGMVDALTRLNNDRSPKLHAEVHCSLVIRGIHRPLARGRECASSLPTLVSE